MHFESIFIIPTCLMLKSFIAVITLFILLMIVACIQSNFIANKK